MTSEEVAKKFNYPLVLKINAEEFYDISGDMQPVITSLKTDIFQMNISSPVDLNSVHLVLHSGAHPKFEGNGL